MEFLQKIIKNYWSCNWSFRSFFHATHEDQMLTFEDDWAVAATHTANYGRCDKTSLVQYNPGWCRFGVMHAQCTCTTMNHISCLASLEYGLRLSQCIWVYSRRKHQNVKSHSESGPLQGILVPNFMLLAQTVSEVIDYDKARTPYGMTTYNYKTTNVSFHWNLSSAAKWVVLYLISCTWQQKLTYSERSGSSDDSGPHEFKLAFINLSRFKLVITTGWHKFNLSRFFPTLC